MKMLSHKIETCFKSYCEINLKLILYTWICKSCSNGGKWLVAMGMQRICIPHLFQMKLPIL